MTRPVPTELNWAGNYSFRAARFHRPASRTDIQELVLKSRKVKALGTRHSFNNIADTDGDLVSLENFQSIVIEGSSVWVGAGVRYGELSRHIADRDLALHNLASLPHISVVGASATATHGSGVKNGNLSTAVSGMEMVLADGSLLELMRSDPDFAGAVVNLGALGIVTRLKLDVIPSFMVRQCVFVNLPFGDVLAHFQEVMASGYSVSLFTTWRGPVVDQVWIKRTANDGEVGELFGSEKAISAVHPIQGMPTDFCTEQLDAEGPWHERLSHFRLEFTPSSGEELQSEYLVPWGHAVEALMAIDSMKDRISPLLQISEVRSIAEDELWMSPCYRQACAGIHFTWVKDWERVRAVLPLIEEKLRPFGARPHWGKLSTMPGKELEPLYPMLPWFRDMARRFDPAGKFRNHYLESTVFAS